MNFSEGLMFYLNDIFFYIHFLHIKYAFAILHGKFITNVCKSWQQFKDRGILEKGKFFIGLLPVHFWH